MKRSASGVTRRDIGRVLVAATAMASSPGSAAAQQQPQSAEDLVTAAREQLKRNSEALRAFRVPIAAEPSFSFRP